MFIVCQMLPSLETASNDFRFGFLQEFPCACKLLASDCFEFSFVHDYDTHSLLRESSTVRHLVPV